MWIVMEKKTENIDGEIVEIVKCKLFGVCKPEMCPAWTELDDWQGCALSLAEMGVTEALRSGARSLDKFMEIARRVLGPPK